MAESLISQFGEQRVAQRHAILQLGSVYGLSALRDLITTTGTASVEFVAAEGEFRLRTNGGGEEAILDTAQRVPYGPGTELEPGAAVRLPQRLTGEQAYEFGIFDSQNGFLKRIDADGLKFIARRAGFDRVTLWGKWDSKDRIQRTASAPGWPQRIDPADGNIWLDPFSWYGYGPWVASIQRYLGRMNATIEQLNVFQTRGQTSLQSPHLPLRQRIVTGADDAGFDAYVAGRQVSVIGDFSPPRRNTPTSRDGVTVAATTGSTWTGLLAVRRRPGAEYSITRIESADIGTTDDIEIAVCLNPTIPNGANWSGGITHLDTAETKLEENLNPGDIDLTSAEWLTKRRIIANAGGNQSGGGPLPLVKVPLIEDKPHVIAARGASGAGSTVQITAQWEEDH